MPTDSYTRCVAHVVNLATQDLIANHSPSAHYDPHNPLAHIPDTSPASLNGLRCDEIGIIRTISVKIRSSNTRRAAWLQLQAPPNPLPTNYKARLPRMLKGDMKVWWGSTYQMVKRAYELREVWHFH